MSAVTSSAATGVPVVAAAPETSAVGANGVDRNDSGTNVIRHVNVPPQPDARTRRYELTNRPQSAKDLHTYQQRQQQGRSNSASSTIGVSGEGGNRTSGRRSPVQYGGGGGGFKSKLRNSFKSTAKRIRQQQTAIDALTKNSQMVGLHHLQDSPRTTAAHRTAGRVRSYKDYIVYIYNIN